MVGKSMYQGYEVAGHITSIIKWSNNNCCAMNKCTLLSYLSVTAQFRIPVSRQCSIQLTNLPMWINIIKIIPHRHARGPSPRRFEILSSWCHQTSHRDWCNSSSSKQMLKPKPFYSLGGVEHSACKYLHLHSEDYKPKSKKVNVSKFK